MKYLILLIITMYTVSAQTDFRYIYQNEFFSEAQHVFQGSDTSWTVLGNTEEENGSYFVFTIDTNKKILNQFRHSAPFYYNGKRIYEYNDSIYVFGNTNSAGGNKIFIHSYNQNFELAHERILDLNAPAILNNGHQSGDYIVLGGKYIDSINKGFLITFNTSTGNINTFKPDFTGRSFDIEAVLFHNDSIFAGGNILSTNHNTSNILLAAFDLSFNQAWSYEEDSILAEGITCLDTFPNGQIIAGGFYHEIGNDTKNVLGLRWSRNGIYKTRIKFTNVDDEFVRNIYTNYDGNILFLIESYKFFNGVSEGDIRGDIILLKTDLNGNWLGGNWMGDVKPDYLNFGMITRDGGVFYCMQTESFNVGPLKPFVAKTKLDGAWDNAEGITININPTKRISFKVFPNPSSSQWHIQFESTEVRTTNLYNQWGQRVYQYIGNTDFQSINNEQLPLGIYYLEISSISGNSRAVLIKR